MSGSQELVSAKYIPDEVVEAEARCQRSRESCNVAAESFMIWGFFAVAMCAIVLFTRAMM